MKLIPSPRAADATPCRLVKVFSENKGQKYKSAKKAEIQRIGCR